MSSASIETTLELWASSLREVKRRTRPLFTQARVALSAEVDALLASGVHLYMVMPMIAGGELIGAISFGGEAGAFPAEQMSIAREVATLLAIAVAQARLYDRVRRHAEELERAVARRGRLCANARGGLCRQARCRG